MVIIQGIWHDQGKEKKMCIQHSFTAHEYKFVKCSESKTWSVHSWIKQSEQWILWLLKIQPTVLSLRALWHRVSVIQFDLKQTHGTLLVLASSWGHVCLEYNLMPGLYLLLNKGCTCMELETTAVQCSRFQLFLISTQFLVI